MQETEKITYRTGTIAPPPEYEPVTAGTDERFRQYVTKPEQPQEPVSEEERRDAEEYFESREENGDGADNTAWHNSTRNIVTNRRQKRTLRPRLRPWRPGGLQRARKEPRR